jgi:tripartite-type tricarboxylate transporter receptor subunit TctC
MKLPRRQFLHLAAGAAVLSATSCIASAQAYPTRPVRIIVGFAAGGLSDILARLLGQWLTERLGQQFVVENRAGAASNLATELVARAPSDGYTLLIFNSSAAINQALYGKLSFQFTHDISPIAAIMSVPDVMVVNPSVPANTVPEFIAYARANPRSLSMGSGGNGSPSHIYGELFKMLAGVDYTCPIPRRRASTHRSARRLRARHYWCCSGVDRVHQSWATTPAGSDHRGTSGCVAEHFAAQRFSARV